MRIRYRQTFIRQLKKLPVPLQKEAIEKIELFREDAYHPFLKTHKLSGKLKGSWSFSVNFAYRIIFEFENKNTVALLMIGDHDIYK